MHIKRIIFTFAAGAIIAAGPALADADGTWKRENGDVVAVSVSNGKLYCKITSGSRPGFEMCNGMAGSGNSWAGKGMKHPSMPGFMKFNGTVSVSGNTLKIKGCAIGQSRCDEETWSR